MIEKMSKITLLVEKARAEQSLRTLRKLGVLHVKPLAKPPSADITEIDKHLEHVRKALAILGNTADIAPKEHKNIEGLVTELTEAGKALNAHRDKYDELLSMRQWYEQWGAVSFEDLQSLQSQGYRVELYRIGPADWEKIKDRPDVFILSQEKNIFQIAMIRKETDAKPEIRTLAFPELSPEKVEKEIGGHEAKLKELKDFIENARCYAGQIETWREKLEKERHFAVVRNGMGVEEEIAYLQGYVPAEAALTVEKAAEKHAWGYVEEEPDASDNPPTKLKNARWIQIIQPVFDFLGTVPGYREKDVSMYFLLFFSVFVAMIIGDAGYGMIFLALAIYSTFKTKKAGKKLPRFITLLYVLSLTTVAWGAITGTWFGSAAIGGLPFFRALTIPQISSFPELYPDLDVNPQDCVMLICFVLAVLQLGLASIINFIGNLPQLKAFEHLGWFSLTVGLFMLVLNLVLGMDMPAFAMPLIGAGFAAIVIFGKQEKGKNFFKGILSGFGGAFNTFLDAISSFSNIISYIRLFAVGMASVAIASSFNDIAAPMMQGPAIIAAVIILLIGHGLNIIMALLSVIVHGIRLNMLEFSGQLGLEWTGYKYEPFSDK